MNDYYQDLGVPRDADGRGDQARLPQAGAQAPPGRQPGPGGRGGVQEGLPGLRRALRPREAPRVRPGRGPLREAGGRRLRPGLLVQRHHGRLLRCRGRRPAAGPRSRQRRGQDALVRLDIDLAARGLRRRARARRRHRGGLRRPATATGPSRAPAPRTCDVCGGRGEVQQVQRSFLGQVMTSRPCNACQGYGTVIPAPASSARATAGSAPGARSRSGSPPVSTPAPGSSSPARARSAPARGPAGDLYVEVGGPPALRSSPAAATTCTARSSCR